ncbi:tRNA (adenosine(37)-N6)-threonylcarbamoyltransferase complex dimerization subunit type 1 TsaB [Chryseotalea sanaruensis]|uniref:tRNA (Adenosine(37)-N6)-threonylcarbamoyltransferase complex dimerization subunit type 1 TsaB n=1 Tax=Chryseotalea sanaruensis TaxID=2482724 RepID=A0A401UFN6_9BACT|nr:tRNA (adenosine(37)-N6)-threonylcarbamoyltransferase complex dimerization subunit type 1 TsaB [Chryseotalea sanaruensis]GCC53677.1 tRNA (adenosine(37)-N6)-threonylcarbamoyltransferase complex dimerization subunit type 1 TsaB [Chryseotalea sanaruensis]
MSLILSLETSVDSCSVALHENGRLLHEELIKEPQAHATKLALLIQVSFQKINRSMRELKAVAITSGPGSYTGLRIGTSTAKGLCFSLNIPLLSVNTLELLIYQASFQNPQNAMLCAMIDARRMEVYSMLANSDRTIVNDTVAEIIEDQSYHSILENQKILFFGNGAVKCKDVINHPNAIFLEDQLPLASFLGELASNKFMSNQFEDLVHFEPFYLKEFLVKKSTKPLF